MNFLLKKIENMRDLLTQHLSDVLTFKLINQYFNQTGQWKDEQLQKEQVQTKKAFLSLSEKVLKKVKKYTESFFIFFIFFLNIILRWILVGCQCELMEWYEMEELMVENIKKFELSVQRIALKFFESMLNIKYPEIMFKTSRDIILDLLNYK